MNCGIGGSSTGPVATWSRSPSSITKATCAEDAPLGSAVAARGRIRTGHGEPWLKPLIHHFGHLPIGQSSCAIQALALVKQPQSRQRTPVWCSQAAHRRRRLSCISGETVFNPEPRN